MMKVSKKKKNKKKDCTIKRKVSEDECQATPENACA
jgi:hypothetical protein